MYIKLSIRINKIEAGFSSLWGLEDRRGSRMEHREKAQLSMQSSSRQNAAQSKPYRGRRTHDRCRASVCASGLLSAIGSATILCGIQPAASAQVITNAILKSNKAIFLCCSAAEVQKKIMSRRTYGRKGGRSHGHCIFFLVHPGIEREIADDQVVTW